MNRTEDQHWTTWRRRRTRAGLRRVEIWIATALRKPLKDGTARLRAQIVPKGSTLLLAVVPRDLEGELRRLVEDRIATFAGVARTSDPPGNGLSRGPAAAAPEI